jgi:hypothetical protein
MLFDKTRQHSLKNIVDEGGIIYNSIMYSIIYNIKYNI